jgi:hypothetical protein
MVQSMKPDFLAAVQSASRGEVQDTVLKDFWLQHLDQQYWATRRYVPDPTRVIHPPE